MAVALARGWRVVAGDDAVDVGVDKRRVEGASGGHGQDEEVVVMGFCQSRID